MWVLSESKISRLERSGYRYSSTKTKIERQLILSCGLRGNVRKESWRIGHSKSLTYLPITATTSVIAPILDLPMVRYAQVL